MSLSSLSMDQALDVWSELVFAYLGKNGFGGDTAEIYIYRLCPQNPTIDLATKEFKETRVYQDAYKEHYQTANRALYELLRKFAHDFSCKVEIVMNQHETIPIGSWFYKGELFDHRVHVKVRKKSP